MDKSKSIKKISEVILDFDNLKYTLGFENYLLNNLDEEDDKKYFIEIWNQALEFKNWNYSDLTIGFEKTLNILKNDFSIEEKVAKIMANMAAYQWK